MPHRTRTLSIDRDNPDPAVIDEAAAILRAGGLVAFATETVYGLGADATDPEAVARIFAAKGRPAINPQIVHADGVAMARTCVASWPTRARMLARRWWPGPLTLVLPKSGLIPAVVTAAHPTVGVRVPKPNVARLLIEWVGRPIAAPSANRSTGISPTLAQHVLGDLDGRIDLILDSGPTEVGLESTVLDLSSSPARVLRPGPIPESELVPAPAPGPPSPTPSPGQMRVHYAPRTPTVWVEPGQLAVFPWPDRAALLVLGEHELPPNVPAGLRRIDLETPDRAARSLYAVLHDVDGRGLGAIVVVPPPDRPEWHALRDRLWRATRPWSNLGHPDVQ